MLSFKSIYLIFITNILFLISINETSALSEEQRKEIEKLRAELNDAFVNYEEEEIPAGVVVQPSWTQQSDNHETKTKVKVKLTKAGMKEAEKLRAEINTAVQHDSYANPADSSRHVQALVKEFGKKDQSKSASDNIVGATAKTTEHVGAASIPTPDGPNTVEANAFDEPDIDIRKLQHLEVSKRRTREMLILKSVEEDYSFDLGDDVVQWAHILHNGKEYFIGRRKVDLLIVHKDKAKYEPARALEVGQPISYLETYSFWNLEQEQQEGVILVASGDKVLWYRGNNVTGQVELHWQWVIGNAITGLTYFTAENKDYLVVSSNESSRTGYYMLNIYQFELQINEFWIAQRMQLQFPCAETTVLDTGRDIILAVPQKNSAVIYTFNPHVDATDHVRFKLKRQITSEGIESIGGFQMGGRSYLALGGLQPQILLYQQGDLVPRTILGHNFGIVQMFFPIPVRTYRDDLILLVQHHVDFGTHGLTVLESLVWDGEAFEASIPMPCQLGNYTVYGVSCMLDIQRDEGLKGAAILRRGDEVSIIVPRHNAESGLFRLHTELLAKNSELLDLQEIFEFLQDWVQEHDDLIAKARAFLNAPDSTPIEAQPDLSELESLTAPGFIFDGELGEIYVNDYKWTEEDSNIELEHILNAIEKLENVLTSERSKREATESAFDMNMMDLERVDVQDLFVELVNNEKFYIQDGALDFDGILNLRQLQVLESVNVREARQTEDELLKINGNLKFELINGRPWTEIRDNLIFRNMPLELTQLEVDGEVIVEDVLKVDVLNSFNFPDDFLWSSGPTVSTVRAQKTFIDTLSANAVDTDGLINGVDPFDAISLSDAQNWTGLPTLSHLKVSEIFTLNGTVRGSGLDNLPKNPTLKDFTYLTANCNFKNIEIHGSVHLQRNFNKISLSPLLADIVQRTMEPEDVITVKGKKSFTHITMPIDFHVESAKVNNIPIEHFVPSHTKQELTTPVLAAHIYFNNLTLRGHYDGVDILELMKNAIKIDEPHVVARNTQLNFPNQLHANALNVLISLNNVPIAEGYNTVLEDISIPTAHFEQVQATTAEIPNDILGTGQLNGVNLREFMQQRTWSEPSTTGNIYLDELVLANGIETDNVHGINATYLLTFVEEVDDLPEMILDGKIEVDHVIVTGDVQINALNNQNFDEDLQLTVIWLNRPNYLSTSLQFAEPLHVHGNLIVEANYNGHNLPTLLDDMIFRNPNGTTFMLAPKKFAKNVRVLGDTELSAINSVPFAVIATKKTICNFRGSLQLNGNLVVDALELSGALNEYPMSTMSSSLRFDRHLHAFILQGANSFYNLQRLDDLTIYGKLNEMQALPWFFDNLVYKNKICILKGKNVFTGRVSIEKGAYVRSLNGYNLLTFLENIVYINEPKAVVVGAPIIFKGPVTASEITIKESLISNNLNGCSLAEWLAESLRVDRNHEISKYLSFASGSLDGNAFYVSFLNDVDLSQVITLHTEQNLSSNLLFSEVYLDGQIISRGSVNNVDLQQAYQNTLLTHGNQYVMTPLTLQTVQVLQNLQTNAAVNNDKDLHQLATLNGDMQFESPLFFQDVTTRNLQTQNLMSGINLDQWFHEALWTNQRSQQFISGNWSVRSLTVKSGPSLPSYMVTGPPALPFNALMRSSHEDKDDLEDICQKLIEFMDKQQKRAFFLKRLEHSFALMWNELGIRDERIEQAFVLAQNGMNYLLINAGCMTSILKWNTKEMHYEKVNNFETGSLEQVLSIPSNDASLNFATNGWQRNCNFKGLNYWHLSAINNLTHVKAFGKQFEEIFITTGQQDLLYAVSGNKLYIYNLTESTLSEKLLLPDLISNDSYRFVPKTSSYNAPVLSNRKWFIVLHNHTNLRDKRTIAISYSLPLHYQRAAGAQRELAESILKPNTSEMRKFTFGDFRQLVESILTDLVNRLHLEVNITQLSIPESDLYDEHLVQDFLDIMQELREQQIYPANIFSAVNLTALKIPENPAQVLAARTVQIIWPVILEIEEIHGYLRTNASKSHPICANITESLGTVIRDVLLLANTNSTNKNSSCNYIHELTAVIERIHKFQRRLELMAMELHSQAKADLEESENVENYEMSETQLNMDAQLPLAESTINFDSMVLFNDSWLKFPNLNVPTRGNGEILELEVSSTQEPRQLLAVTYSKPHFVAGQHAGIALYLDTFRDSLFQSIAAHKPRALNTVRIRHETLLAFVEGCCEVKVLIYRGVQGFVEFTHFKTVGQVLKLLSFTLPGADNIKRYYLATVLEDRVVFYKLIVAGANMVSPLTFVCN